MDGQQIDNLIQVGATDTVRKKLKRLGIPARLKTLKSCIPYVSQSTESLAFFRNNFAKELGAIMMSEDDLEKAERLYRTAQND